MADGDDGNAVVVDTNIFGHVANDAFVVMDHEGVAVTAAAVDAMGVWRRCRRHASGSVMDHCNLGPTHFTKTINDQGIFEEHPERDFSSQYLAASSMEFCAKIKVGRCASRAKAGIVACAAARLAGRYQRSSRC